MLSLVFKYCDDRGLPLLDLPDLRTVLQYLTGDGAGDLKDYGGMSKATVGVLLRDMVELEQQGALAFFGEPEFDLDDLMRTEGGQGLVSILELTDVQDKPALFSTFMMWMLARLYHDLPEVGDIDKPKLVFFFDEAHLLFDNASKELLNQIEQVVRLIRSKGVGVFFITQNPKDVPPDVLGQLGHRVQHALRAFTPDDDKALKAAAAHLPEDRVLRHRGDAHHARHRRGAGHRAGAEGYPDAAVRDADDPARVAHGAAHRRRVRAEDSAGRHRFASTPRRSTARARARCWRGAWRPKARPGRPRRRAAGRTGATAHRQGAAEHDGNRSSSRR